MCHLFTTTCKATKSRIILLIVENIKIEKDQLSCSLPQLIPEVISGPLVQDPFQNTRYTTGSIQVGLKNTDALAYCGF